MAGAGQARLEARRRQARRVGAAGFLLAAALPLVLFYRVIGSETVKFRFDLRYLIGWAPWALMLAGLLLFVPVAVSAGLDPASRLYPRARRAYAGWGTSCYVLGFGLATQVAQIVGTSPGH